MEKSDDQVSSLAVTPYLEVPSAARIPVLVPDKDAPKPSPRVLVVDDNETVRLTPCKILQKHGVEVTCAADVIEALRFIGLQAFDVLLSDLHMPGPGDGLTVVSAMRHKNPDAVTLLLSAFPEMSAAANVICMQTDEILVKPMRIPDLIQAITQRLAKGPCTSGRSKPSQPSWSERLRRALLTGMPQ